ncbi:hypothetical protein ACKWTF_005676 [Chironomus riparius]
MKFVLMFLIFSGYLIIKNSALMCYYCKSHQHASCEAKKDPPNFTSMNCESVPDTEKELGAQNYCYKVKKEVLNEPNNISMVYNRGCTIGGGRTDFCLTQYIRDPEVKCYLCNDDRCNDANVLRIGEFLMFVSFILVIVSSYSAYAFVM